jgi:hypothetical protein
MALVNQSEEVYKDLPSSSQVVGGKGQFHLT